MIGRLKIYLKYVRYQGLLAVLCLCFLSSVSPVLAGHGDETVLILHSYHPSLGWTAGIMDAMQERLAAKRPDLSLHVEYLDVKRNPGPAFYTSYVEGILPQKLAGRHFDLILTSDNDAFNFVRRHRNDLFRDVPVVFCGVNGFVAEMITPLGGMTGVAEAPSFQETVEVALSIHPETRELIFVGETLTETGRQNDMTLHQLTDSLPAELSIQFWNDRPLEELEPVLGRLTQGQVVLLASVISNRSGKVLSFEESARHVREHSSVPIYGFWDFFLGEGIVGGHLTSSHAQGELAANLGLRILAGESADDIPVTISDSNRYLFDYNQLQKFGVSLNRLPVESTVINQPASFYHLDKWQFWAGVTIILLLCFSLFLLIWIMVLRRKAESILAERVRLADLDAEIGRVLTRGGDLSETLQACVRILLRQTGTALGRIWTISDVDPTLLELQASAGLSTRTDGKHRFKRIGEMKVGIIGSQRQPVLTNQVAGDPLFTDQEWVRREGIIGFAGYPLVVKDRLVGVIAFFSKQPLSEAVQASIASVADMIAIGIERHRAEEALQGLDQIKSEFIATAAHELRTPLTTILGYAELLSNDMLLPGFPAEQREEYLGYIIAKSEALEKIIDELLDLGRIETGRTIVLDRQPCEMIAMVQQVILHYSQENQRHQFVDSCPVECLDIDIDQAKIQRVFDNLISNAVKYSPRGGTIRIEGRLVYPWLEISIADEGIGMTPEQAAMVFDKFYRVNTSDTAVRGLGLGLTISKGIIEAHGGKIWIESEIGQGTRVVFLLPLPERSGE
ncbi:MAG: sensor histidine kinase [Desulfuromonadales bacterium]|nr:sensor histidine kinase [Desulfuromonadales bacterium]